MAVNDPYFSIMSYILLYKVVRFFCLKLKILITTELIEFSFLGKLHISYWMVLGYSIYRYNQWDDLKLFSLHLLTYPLNAEPLDARGAPYSRYIKFQDFSPNYSFLKLEISKKTRIFLDL